jgi:hypothetical protein
MARELVDAVPRLAGCPFVFSTTTTTPVSGWSKVKERMDRMMQAELGEEFEPWRTHDLRRTAATGLERLGVPLPVTEALLGHTAGSKAGIASIYQLHNYAAEKREAVEKWAGARWLPGGESDMTPAEVEEAVRWARWYLAWRTKHYEAHFEKPEIALFWCHLRKTNREAT